MIGGFLFVGINDAGEVVVNLDQDRTGHIVFSPAQARHLARLLDRKADEAEPSVPIDEDAFGGSPRGDGRLQLPLRSDGLF